MYRRTWVFLAVALVAAGTLTLGTSGFSTAEIDRPVSVTVADGQASAFVPLADPGERGTHPAPEWVDDSSQLRETPVKTEGSEVPLFLVHNRFEHPLTVDTQFVWGELDGVSDIGSVTLESGETGVVNGSVDCGGYSGSRMVELNVTASTQGVTAHITYQVTVDCAVPTQSTASQNAGGPASESE